MKNENFTINEIEQKLKRYCSYQDRCHSEVEKKLKEFDLIEEAKNKILFNLINENYLNESRFSENFVRGKFKIKNWGKIKIVQELKSRNISDINIKRGLMEIDEVEYKNKLENIFNKKLSSLGNQSVINKKKKIFSYLSYRGWETNLIYEKINKIQ
jgi:regulatory protein